MSLLVPTNCKTFLQYSGKVFTPHMFSQAVDIQRIAVVCVRHFQDSLKSETRNNWSARVCTKFLGMEKQ